MCPALEHLVLHPREFLDNWRPALFRESTSAAHFPRLCFLDVWITNDPDAALWDAKRSAALLTHACARIARALEGVRALPVCSPGLPYALPTICHPSAMRNLTTGADSGSNRSDESRLVCVRPPAEWWVDEGMWLEDDSSDYVYESPSEDSAEGSEWDSDPGSELSEGSVIGS